MILLLCLIFILWAVWSACCDADEEGYRKEAERASERRHRELMEAQKKRKRNVRRTRTVARDERGRTVAQEIMEEEL